MSHVVFQTALISPSPSKTSLSLKPSLPIPRLAPIHSLPLGFRISRRRSNYLVIKNSSSSALTDGCADSSSAATSALERCFVVPPHSGHSLPAVTCPEFGPVMKKDYGAFGAVTLEKGKLDTSAKQEQASGPELATGGGGDDGGGDGGKRINHGGGDGGDDDGNDDDDGDDFDGDDEGDEGGLFRIRMLLEELFDRKFVDAVLNEWKKTMMDLPAGLRQGYEMGLVSSAQMVKFLAINARPTTVRYISRGLPEGISRAFIGRMIADPAFLYKLLLELVGTIGCTVWWEFKTRKDRIKEERGLALVVVDVLTKTLLNVIVVWSLAPSRSYGNTFRFDLQNTMQKLPNNIFEKSYPLRDFDLQKRIHSLFYKTAELSMVGLNAGAVLGALSNYLGSKKKDRLSVTNPSMSTYTLGYGAFLGLYANFRYQMLCGFEKVLSNHFDVIRVALFFGTALRLLNVQLGERSKHAWLGIEANPLAQSENLLKAYNRPADQQSVTDSSKWFISKNAIVSGLGLLGLKQGNVNSEEAPAPKARRKRVVRKKVSA